MNEKEVTRAKNIAYRYLSFRPRSKAEVEQKLRDKEIGSDVITIVLSDLSRLGYINDEQFAREWSRSRIRLRGFGRRRIEQELREKGINREGILEALNEVFRDSSEEDTARQEAEKKLKNLSRLEPEVQRRRLAGFLERKGFSSSLIHTILREIKQ